MRRKIYRGRRRTASGNKRVFRVDRSFLPTKLKKTFNYCEKITLDAPTAGASTSYFFSCNSMHDPNRTGTGHQPMGYDEFVGVFYDHYCVIGAKINVTVMSQTGTISTANQVMSLHVRDTNTTTTDITQAIEQGKTTYGFLGGPTGGAPTLTLQKGVNPAKFLGISKPLATKDMWGNLGANPQEECYFEINLASIGTDDPDAVDCLVTIEYTAMLLERKKLSQS